MARAPYQWTDADRHALVRAAQDLNMRPLDLLAVLHSESGLNPWAIAFVEGQPAARGLNQISKTVAFSPKMNLSTAEWESITTMTPEQNLPYVVRSFRSVVGNRVYADAGEIYAVNFAPALLLSKGGGNDVVLYSSPGKSYKANSNLDVDHKGYITIGDLRKRLTRDSNYVRFLEEADRLRALYPNVPDLLVEAKSNAASSSEWLWWVGGAGVLAAATTAAWVGVRKGYLPSPKLSLPKTFPRLSRSVP